MAYNHSTIRKILSASIIALIACFAVFIMFNNNKAKADINPMLNFTGKITDSDSVAVADNVYDFSFGLYTTATSGTAIWSENLAAATTFAGTISAVSAGTNTITYTFTGATSSALKIGQYLTNATTDEYKLISDYDTSANTVTVVSTVAWDVGEEINNRPRTEGGVVDIDIGSVSDLSSVNFNQILYLQVTFNGETMQPRKMIVPVAQAFNADKLDGYDASDFANTADDITVIGEWDFDNVLDIATSSATTALSVTQSGAGDIINLFSGLDEVFTVTDDGYVGIGAVSPTVLLTVGSSTPSFIPSADYYNSAYISGDLEVYGTIYGGVSGVITPGGISEGAILFVDGDGNLAGDGNNLFWDDTNNRLGIGTTTPNYPLDVEGDVYFDGTSITTGQGIFNYAPQTAGTDNIADSSLYVNATGAVADANLLGLADAGTWKFRVDKEGDVFIQGNLITYGIISQATADIVGNLTVEGYSLLGDAPNNDYLEAKGYVIIKASSTQSALTVIQDSSYSGDILNLFSGDTEVLTVLNNSGNVGIGTTTPYSKLTIWGGTGNLFELANTASTTVFAVNTDGDLTMTGTTTMGAIIYPNYDGTADQMLYTDGSGNLAWASTSTLGLVGDGDFSSNGIMVRTSDGVYATRTLTGAANEITITNGDGVSGAPTFALPDVVYLGNSGKLGRDADNLLDFSTDNQLIFRTNGANQMLLDSSGRLGIGTTTPVNVLSVLSADGAQLRLSYDADNYVEFTAGSAGALTISPSGVDASTTIGSGDEALRITSDGYVGIGTSTPYSKLTVWGDGTSGASAFGVIDSASSTLFTILDNGYVGINNVTPSYNLDVDGTARITGTTQLSTTTMAVWNNVVVVDGVNYSADGTGIQAAIDALPDEGGKVFIPEGTYSMTSTTTIPSNVWLEGAGASSTILYLADGANTAVITNSDWTNGNSHIKISNLKIDGNDANNTIAYLQGHCIYFSKVTYSEIDSVYAYDAEDSGIYLHNYSNYNTVSNSIAESNDYGITIRWYSYYNNIANNTANSNTTGIYVYYANYNAITGNTSNSNTTGITFNNADSNAVTGNTINSNTQYGIYIGSSAYNTITGNTINSNTQHGIHLATVHHSTITGNTLYNNGASNNYDGISIGSSDNNIISSNRIVDTAGTGYAIDITSATSDNNVLVGNYYSGTGATAINDLGTGTIYNTQLVSDDLILKSAGNVGIGTTSPYSKLTVWADSTSDNLLELVSTASTTVFAVNTDGDLTMTGTTTMGALIYPNYDGTADQMLYTDGSGNLAWASTSTLGLVGDLDFSSNGIMVRTSSGAYTTRTLTGTTNEITIADGDGVSANPTFQLPDLVYLGTSGKLGRDADNLLDFSTDNQLTFRINATDQMVLDSRGYLGIGTTTPQAALHIGTASSTNLTTYGDSVFISGELEVGETAYLGPMEFAADSGAISWIDMPVTSGASIGTAESYTARIDGTSLLTVYSESDGAGGIQNTGVGIGTTSPLAKLSVQGTSGTPILNIASSTGESILYVDEYGRVGIGTASPSYNLDVAGTARITGATTLSTTTMSVWNNVVVVDGVNYSADGTGIQAAIDALPAEGGKVFIPEGTYNLTSTLTVPSNVWLEGAGASSTILYADGINASVIQNSDTTNGNSHIKISNLKIDGNDAGNTAGDGIYFNKVTYSQIDSIYVYNADDYGIYFISSASSTISQNIIESNSSYGIEFESSNNNIITENIIQNNRRSIYLSSSSYNTIIGNTASYSSQLGIYIISSSYNTINGNTINNNSQDGIGLSTDANNNSIVGNTIYDNGGSNAEDGIWLYEADNNIISSNRISDTTGTGYAINISNSACDNNVIVGNYYSGTGASSINDAGTGTRYTQPERLTITTSNLGEVAYSPFYMHASSSAALLSVRQDSDGDIVNIFDGADEVFTILDGGNVGIGTSSPLTTLSVQGTAGTPIMNIASSTGASVLYVDEYGKVGIGNDSPAYALDVSGAIRATLSLSAGINVETLAADKTLTPGVDKMHQYLDEGGANRIITLATAGAIAGDRFIIRHNGAYNDTNYLEVKQSATMLDRIYAGAIKEFIFDGTNWISGETGAGESDNKKYNVAIGYFASGYDRGAAVGYYASGYTFGAAVGHYASGYSSGAAVGYYADGYSSGAAVGYGADGYSSGVAVGSLAKGYNYGAAIGYAAESSQYGFSAGYSAGTNIDNANSVGNILIGRDAGDTITTGDYNIIIGHQVDGLNATADSFLNIGDTIYGDLSAGNVGIGTTTPYSKLTVWGDGTSGLSAFSVIDSASSTLFTVLDNGYVGIGTSSPLTTLTVQGTAGTPIMNIASSTGASVLYVDEYGKVGIGNDSPAYALDVSGAIRATLSLSAGINIETLAADKTLTAGVDKMHQYLDEGGANRIITLATAGAVAGDRFIIRHNGAYNDTNYLQVKQSATELDIIFAGAIKEFIFDGTNWISGETGAGENDSKKYNVAVGHSAQGYDLGAALGYAASGHTSGAALGYAASGHTSGAALGRSAAGYTSGAAVGYYALGYTSGAAVGYLASGYISGAAVGYQAKGHNYGAAFGYEAESSQYGFSAGYSAGSSISNAGSVGNILIGMDAGDTIETGDYNIIIGYQADGLNATADSFLNIGDTIYGDLSAGNVGIGTTTPYSKLTVWADGTSGLSAFSVIDSASSTLFTVLDNGYVGIGTASPSYNLEVVGTVSFGSDTAGDILFDTTTITNPVLVGIGTTTPDADLTIVSDQVNADTYLFTIATSTDGSDVIDRKFAVDSDGDFFYDGTAISPAADYAEYFYTVDTDLESGEVVCVDITKENAVKRCERAADGNVMGIVSTKPAIIGNAKEEYENNINYKIIGMLGQVQAKISLENGDIRPGDSLTSASSTPGYIMKAGAGDPTVGVALEGLTQEGSIVPAAAGLWSQDAELQEGSTALRDYGAINTGVINVLISRRNKSLTVELVEQKITDRIAAMEIEDEVQILISNAVDNINLDSEIQIIVDDQMALLSTDLTVEVDAVSGELMAIAVSVDNLIARIGAAEERITNYELRITNYELGISVDENGNVKMGNLEETEFPARNSVSVVEIVTATTTARTVFVVNQQGDGDVADFQTDGVSIVNIADSGKVTIVGEMLVDGRIMVCSGGACGSALDERVDETMGDMGVEGTVVAGAFEGYCDEGFVWVSGSAKYGTLPGFCVMADEMKIENSSKTIANIKHYEAILACQEIGDGYHLISENEWLTIAEDIIRVADNDVNEEMEGLQLATTSTLIATTTEFVLSNGNIIFNLIGGVAEWTDQTIIRAGLPAPISDEWQEYYDIENYNGFNIAPPYYYSSANGIGRIKTGDNEIKSRGFVRGENALYDLDLSNGWDTATSTIGFRCAK